MIARLALLEADIAFESRLMDIHFAKEQITPWYMALNPHMTVPTLVDGKKILIDSRDILNFSAKMAGQEWLDCNIRLLPQIEKIVKAFYLIPIEDLTFVKAMIKIVPLQFIIPKVLGRIIKSLKSGLPTCADPVAVKAKIELNERRIAYFTGGDLQDKLAIERKHISAFLSDLPSPQAMLLGDQISSADIVTAILLGRLKMVGEYDLLNSYPLLDQWFNEMQLRPAFTKADIWLAFHFWRMLLKR